MSDDLAYARTDLDQLGTELKTLSQELRNDGQLSDVGVDEVAHQTVVDALGDFANDWDDKREALAESLEAISEMAIKASETFGEADADLAKAVREALEGEQ
ncbi:hypothetical protein IEQ44_06125 [Nocardioides sp. Y6]|uniref:Excreted virulence factor EspC (Type VII ESX diderm) n=1 Tax=Nocardioides malaquae TaxID=2773426 RepID=A0ABR9RRN3_9ACTN|nr:hypothetical protein [Nocardioides malaquae]MBE7324223.1 hypothetical protein [Nocardioides malaquae]